MPEGQRVGYVRVSTLDQRTERQLDGVPLDRVFTDRASGKDRNRPQLAEALAFVREGDSLVCHSIDRLARNLDDLRALVSDLTARGVRVEFVKEGLVFTGDEAPLCRMLLSVMGALAEFERALILERQREGIALAKLRGAFTGGSKKLSEERAAELRRRASEAGVNRSALAREFGIAPSTLYLYLKRPDEAPRSS